MDGLCKMNSQAPLLDFFEGQSTLALHVIVTAVAIMTLFLLLLVLYLGVR